MRQQRYLKKWFCPEIDPIFYLRCMQLFYMPSIEEGLCALPEGEARHATQVLRKRVGDVLDIVDGKGGWYKGEIIAAAKKSCTIQATLRQQEPLRGNPSIVMAVSPTKNNERFEWFLEKATELGVDEIVPLQCKRTERSKIRLDRYEKVLVSAMKQSLQAWLPRLHPLTPLKEWLQQLQATKQRYVGWCDEVGQEALSKQYMAGEDVIILIGPEGDFTEEEIEMSRMTGYMPMTLGANRLRTETAAIAALHTIKVLNALR